jgi:hypothetical protein
MRKFVVLALFLAACGNDNEEKPEGWMPMEPVDMLSPDAGEDAGEDVGPTEPDLPPPDPCAECPVGTLCINDVCETACTSDDTCPDGLACVTTPAGDICQAPTGVADGEACAQDTDCQGGTCITDWTDGYCTTLDCGTFADCSRLGEENRCLQQQGSPNLCVRMCESSSDCREGYVCERLNARQGLCAPDPRVPIDPAVLADLPFEIVCEQAINQEVTITYTVNPATTSYMLTPFAPSNRQIRVQEIGLPSGSQINLTGGPNGFQSVPNQIFDSHNPMVIPALPQFAQQLESGTHTLRVLSEDDQLCWYKIEKETPGNVIDVNVYLVGLPNINASNAETDPNFVEVMAEFDALYRAAGVALRTVRYFDVSPEAADRFDIVRDEASLPLLLSESQRPGSTLEDVMSVNLFFVRAFNLGGAIGISYGLPGPAGLHGMGNSGVVFTSQYMGRVTTDGFGEEVDGNFFTAQVLAHEVGHYMGLFHTSEQNGFSFDPVEDTPRCQQISANCPDITNLMFPLASTLNTEISPDQAFVLSANPLTQYDPNVVIEDPDMGGDMNGDADMGGL